MSQPKDVRDMTLRELADLAQEVRCASPGSVRLRRAADRMAIATWCLQDGALQQMMWWAGSDIAQPEPPPDARGEVPEPSPGGRLVTVLSFPTGQETMPEGERGGR